MSKRQCYAVFASQYNPEKGYMPSLVTEDEPGHSPLKGRGPESEPWWWGTTLEEAQRICDMANANTFGLDPIEAKEIVDSSIAAQIREDARLETGSVDYLRKLGKR